MDAIVIEPGSIARDDDRLGLGYHNVFPWNPLSLWLRGLVLLDGYKDGWSLGGDGGGRRGVHVCWRESGLVGGG